MYERWRKPGNLDPCCGACSRRDRRVVSSSNRKMTTGQPRLEMQRGARQCCEEVEKQSCAALTKARSGSRCSTVMEPPRRVTLGPWR